MPHAAANTARAWRAALCLHTKFQHRSAPRKCRCPAGRESAHDGSPQALPEMAHRSIQARGFSSAPQSGCRHAAVPAAGSRISQLGKQSSSETQSSSKSARRVNTKAPFPTESICNTYARHADADASASSTGHSTIRAATTSIP